MKKKDTKGWSKHIFFLGVGLSLFGLFLYLTGVDGFNQLGQVKLIPLSAALLATLGISGSVAVRWGILANAIGGYRVASWLEYYYYFIISRAMGFILPKDVTDLVSRSVFLNKLHGLSLTQSGASVVFDRLFDVLFTFIFLLSALPYWLGWVNELVGIGLMLGFATFTGGLLFISYRQFLTGVVWGINCGFRMIQRLPWLRNRPANLINFTILDRGVVLRAYLFSLIKFGCTAGRLILFAITLSVPISPTLILFGTPLGQLTYLFAFTPGGLGIFEAGWFAILRIGGVRAEHVLIFVVGQRILTVILVVVLTLFSQLLYIFRSRFSQSGHNFNSMKPLI